ncbi:MAG: DUF3159 domain-containing protein [Anaerolineales bacterium]|nr:DUF3159 domain-containing protein [Anaerolineales bacterium]
MIRELLEEFRSVVVARSKILDAILPPLIFVVVNVLVGLEYAIISAIIIAILFSLYRLLRSQSVGYALGGLGSIVIASVLVRLSGRPEGYFLPSVVSGALTALACLMSIMVGRPLVAFTSHIARGWPLGWYWHPRVSPAYNEVTGMWTLFFALRALVQFALYRGPTTEFLNLVNLILGWPALIVLLAASYIYGTQRLRKLSGPSVEEFKAGTTPPWSSQRRGF